MMGMIVTHLKKIPGVYRIVHLPTGKTYVGSSLSVRDRVDAHRTRLRGSRGQSPLLQELWSATSEDEWIVEVLEDTTEQEAIELVPVCLRLNVILGSIGGRDKWSPEVRESMIAYREEIGFVMPEPRRLSFSSPEERESYRRDRRRAARARRRSALVSGSSTP